MSIAVIASLGTSSPPVTSYLEVCGHEISRLEILSNLNQEVISHTNLIKTGLSLSPKYHSLNVNVRSLQHNDVITSTQCNDFLKLVADTIVDLKKDYDSIFLNAAGGRKTMTILLGLIAQLQLVDGLYHVIAKDQNWADKKSFEYKGIIVPFSTKSPEDQKKHYNEHKEKFDDYLFPDSTEFERVQILTLPIDREVLLDIVNDLLNNDSNFDEKKKIHYEQSGFIDGYEDGWTLTREGRGFLEAIQPALKLY